MSTHVIGHRSNNDPTYLKHAKVLRACIDAEIEELPKETAEYFGHSEPDEYTSIVARVQSYIQKYEMDNSINKIMSKTIEKKGELGIE